eukprot:868906-Prorocentrum_minimum.AAC.1
MDQFSKTKRGEWTKYRTYERAPGHFQPRGDESELTLRRGAKILLRCLSSPLMGPPFGDMLFPLGC